MNSFDELMGLAEVYVGIVIDELYRRLLERYYIQDYPEVIMLKAALTNILGHENRGTAPRKSF